MPSDDYDSDWQLVNQLAQADHMALERLMDRHGKAVEDVCKAITRNQVDAEDLKQFAFSALLENCTTLTNGEQCSLRAWLCRVARNRHIDHVRKVGTEKDNLPDLFAHLEFDIKCDKGDPSYIVECQDLADRVKKAIRRLSQEEQDIIRAMYWDGHKIPQIAEINSEPPQTLYSLHKRAIKKLKYFLRTDLQ